ncbi:MAG TPA: hypothetical protein VEB63_03965 [Chitinophagaceae bacterium]|nr:hypothetical protein [Chitinophagaceae bacterium]
MPNRRRNRRGEKTTDRENRTGRNSPEQTSYRKLRDNLRNQPDQSISTADDTAGGIYSKTRKRDDEVRNEDTRGGR